MASRKGRPNKITKSAKELAESMGIDPLAILLQFAMGDFESLELTSQDIKPRDRQQAASDACKYIYPAQKAIELADGQPVIKVIMEDYQSKK